MLDVVETTAGLLLPVLAQPQAGRDEIVGVHDGRLKVRVTAAPEKGKANAAILKLLAGVLDVSRSRSELVRGTSSKRKEFLIRNVTKRELLARLGTPETGDA